MIPFIEVLQVFRLELLPSNYKNELDKLLNYRNNVAHGDDIGPVDLEFIGEMSSLVQELMAEVIVRLEEGFSRKSLLKPEYTI